MKKQANLNSQEWCDLIFEGKNKEYGAYKLRQTAGKRYLYAFGTMLAIVLLIVLIPKIVSKVRAATEKIDGIKETYIMTEVIADNFKSEPEVIKPEMPELPKEKFAMMEKFTPPAIVEDDAITDPDDLMPDQEKLASDKRKAIGAYQVDNGSFDSDAVRKELENAGAIMGDKKEEGGTAPISFAEVMPQFPGGQDEMYRYISSNLRYPITDQEIGTQGRVTVQFVVSKDGAISKVKVLRGISPSCDKEAVKVVQSMPKWIPGRQNGVAVAVYFTLPIVFKLN